MVFSRGDAQKSFSLAMFSDRAFDPDLRDHSSRPTKGTIMTETKDSNGAFLADGDSVTLIKDLRVKGSSVTLKRGTVVKNIRLTDDPAEIECNAEKVKGLVLRTEFLKKHN
jgi:protein PhnA